MNALVIPTFNRPDYLIECLSSIDRADTSGFDLILVDDGSTDRTTLDIVSRHRGVHAGTNLGIATRLLKTFDECFANGYEYVMNLDSDAVVRNDFAQVVLHLKKKYPEHIVTGFHSVTKNKDGSERHHILADRGHGYEKRSVGGINMCFDRPLYEKYIRPALVEATKKGNWDFLASMNALQDGRPMISVKESVVEHIGHVSSMGHNHDQPDTAEGFKHLSLPSVTLMGISCDDFPGLEKAAEISQTNIRFGAVKLLTSVRTDNPRAVRIDPLTSKAEYNKFVLKELAEYIETDFVLIIQADGYLLNWRAWTDDFLKFDYVGAPWMWYPDHYKVGNGGFSLRSRRLHQILREDNKIIPENDGIIHNYEEDHNICRQYRKYLELVYRVQFAPTELADRFSMEAFGRKDKRYAGQLGFHGGNIDFSGSGLTHIPYRLPVRKKPLPYLKIKHR